MPASKAQQKAVSKYMKENYDEIKIRMGKGKKETIQAAAAAVGESVNAYINTAITLRIERDSGETPSARPQEAEAVSLPYEAIKTAQEAAEAAGEAMPHFIARAISETAERDTLSHRMEGGTPNE